MPRFGSWSLPSLRPRPRPPSPPPPPPCGPQFLAAAAGYPLPAAHSFTGVDPRRPGGAIGALPSPSPIQPPPRRFLVALSSATTSATTSTFAAAHIAPFSSDGTFAWRIYLPRLRRRPTRVLPSPESPIPTRLTRTAALLRFRADRTARVELKRQGKHDTLNLVAEDLHLGTFKLSLTPQKRCHSALAFKHPVLSLLPFLNSRPSPHSLPHHPPVTASPAVISHRHTSPPSSSTPSITASHPTSQKKSVNSTSRSRRVVPAPSTSNTPLAPARLKNTSTRFPASRPARTSRSRTRKTTSRNDLKSERPVLRTELEYLWKDKRWTYSTSFEAGKRQISLRFIPNPRKFTPRVQLPVALWHKGWVGWSREPKSSVGELQVGRGEMWMSHAWTDHVFKLGRRKGDGSTWLGSLSASKVVKLEHTYVGKAMKGRMTLTVSGCVANQKEQTGGSVSINGSLGTLSAFVKSSKSCGLFVDGNFQHKRRLYHVAVKMEDVKSLSLRLGVFF